MGGFGDFISAPFNAGASALNSVTSAWNDISGKTATQMSIDAAKANTAAQIKWERERAKNAHQWEIKDLEKAGLNPILSAGGSGAVTGGISPQMPDTSHYKGAGALIPLISNYYDNITKNSAAAKASAEADLASTRKFTEKTQQILNTYNAGLIDKKTAGQAIENEINQINKDWLPWEKGVGIAAKAANAVTPLILYGGGKKLIANTAMQLSREVKGISKSLKVIEKTNKGNSIWKNIGDGQMVNTITGEIRRSGKRILKILDKNGNPINPRNLF